MRIAINLAPFVFAVAVAGFNFAPGTSFAAPAQPPLPVAPKGLAAKEKAARGKAAKGALELAAWCGKNGAVEEARRNLCLVGLLNNDNLAAQKELAKISAKPDKLKEDHESKVAEQRAKALKAGQALLDHAIECRKADAEDFGLECAAIWWQFFRDDDALQKAGWQWYEPHAMLMPAEDAKRIEGGALRVNGTWIEADLMKEQDKAHADWKDPWKVHDGWHEVRTTLPLERARYYLGFVSQWRVHVLAKFAAELDLRRPTSLLAVIVTDDRSDYVAQRAAIMKGYGQPDGPDQGEGGLYLGHTLERNCPTLVCYKLMTPAGPTTATEIGMRTLVQHEVLHQLMFEGRKWNASTAKRARIEHGDMVCEGLATMMENYFWDGQKFVWRFLRTIKGAVTGQVTTSRFARALEARDQLPSMDELSMLTNDQYVGDNGLRNYAHGCCLAWFMLNKCTAQVREKYLKAAALVHSLQYVRETFIEVMKGEDTKKLDTEFKAWLETIKFED